MDNLEANLKNIQGQIDSLTKMLSDAQNQKIATEVRLQNEQQEYDSLTKQLQEMTGLNDINDIQTYMANKETELNEILNDIQSVSNCINDQYNFTEKDVVMLKNIIDKYNIPMTGE